ncbi:hypothetical protein BKI52_19380 [marine bacterium AO1-C]|nr:hypothetical protein BKI52_19380 [marine bacterium AO1-C]
MPDFYFFTEPDLLASQTNNHAPGYTGFDYPFGYRTWNGGYPSQARQSYILTSSHQSKSNKTCSAFAITSGRIIICPVIDNKSAGPDLRTNRVNIVLMPDESPAHLPKIKYFVYRNIQRDSILDLLPLGDIPANFPYPINASGANNDYIYGVSKAASLPIAGETVSDQIHGHEWADGLYNFLSFGLDVNSSPANATPNGILNSPVAGNAPPAWFPNNDINWKPTMLEALFDFPADGSLNLLGGPIQVRGGTNLGKFTDGFQSYFGLDIIFDTYQYQPTLEDVMTVSSMVHPDPQANGILIGVRNFKIHHLDNTNLQTDEQKYRALNQNDIVNHYLDPCAFFSSFIELPQKSDDKLHLKKDGDAHFSEIDGWFIFLEIIKGSPLSNSSANFYNHDKVYIDIRNEHGSSYSFYAQNSPNLRLRKGKKQLPFGVNDAHPDIAEINSLVIPAGLAETTPYETIKPTENFVPQMVISTTSSGSNSSHEQLHNFSKPSSNTAVNYPSAATTYFYNANNLLDPKQYLNFRIAFPNKNTAGNRYKYYVHFLNPLAEAAHPDTGVIAFDDETLPLPGGTQPSNRIYELPANVGDSWTEDLIIRIRSSKLASLSGSFNKIHAKWNIDSRPVSNYIRLTFIEKEIEINQPGAPTSEYPRSFGDVNISTKYPVLQTYEYLDNIFEPEKLANWLIKRREHLFIMHYYVSQIAAPARVTQAFVKIFGDSVYVDDTRRSGKHFMGNVGVAMDSADNLGNFDPTITGTDYGSVTFFIHGQERFFTENHKLLSRGRLSPDDSWNVFLRRLANGPTAQITSIATTGGIQLKFWLIQADTFAQIIPDNFIYIWLTKTRYEGIIQNLPTAPNDLLHRYYLCFTFHHRHNPGFPYPDYSAHHIQLRGFKYDTANNRAVEQVIGPVTDTLNVPIDYYQVHDMFSRDNEESFFFAPSIIGENRTHLINVDAAGTRNLTSTLYVVRDLHMTREEFKKFQIYLKYVLDKAWSSYDIANPNHPSNKGLVTAAAGNPIVCNVDTLMATGHNLGFLREGDGIVFNRLAFSGGRSYVWRLRYMQHYVIEAELQPPVPADPYDNLPLYDRLTAAHEFGHMMGLVDRYAYFANVFQNIATGQYGSISNGASSRYIAINQENGMDQNNDLEYINGYGWQHNLMSSASARVPMRDDLFAFSNEQAYIAQFWDEAPNTLNMNRSDFDIESILITSEQWRIISNFEEENSPLERSAFFGLAGSSHTFIGAIINRDAAGSVISITNISDNGYVASTTDLATFNSVKGNISPPVAWQNRIGIDDQALVRMVGAPPLQGRLKLQQHMIDIWPMGFTSLPGTLRSNIRRLVLLYAGNGLGEPMSRRFSNDPALMNFSIDTVNEEVTSTIDIDDGLLPPRDLDDISTLSSPFNTNVFADGNIYMLDPNIEYADAGGVQIWNAHTDIANNLDIFKIITNEADGPTVPGVNIVFSGTYQIDLRSWTNGARDASEQTVRLNNDDGLLVNFNHIRQVRFKEHFNRSAIIILHSNGIF